MSTISNTTNMTIRIDKSFKSRIDNLFSNLGINTTSAIMMFLKQCDREQGLPFKAKLETPNNRLLAALNESEDIISGKITSKKYDSFDEIIDEINNEV